MSSSSEFKFKAAMLKKERALLSATFELLQPTNQGKIVRLYIVITIRLSLILIYVDQGPGCCQAGHGFKSRSTTSCQGFVKTLQEVLV